MEILGALEKRFKITREIGKFKIKHAMEFRDVAREEKIIKSVRDMAVEFGLDENMVESIFRIIMDRVVEEYGEILDADTNSRKD